MRLRMRRQLRPSWVALMGFFFSIVIGSGVIPVLRRNTRICPISAAICLSSNQTMRLEKYRRWATGRYGLTRCRVVRPAKRQKQLIRLLPMVMMSPMRFRPAQGQRLLDAQPGAGRSLHHPPLAVGGQHGVNRQMLCAPRRRNPHFW